ncbi:hypothetical protein C8R44DRAFT_878200 [Mycena epipterygia]|nr:hypothetical protein C8R44DRAFT_878200 [Mycena epipterygia]
MSTTIEARDADTFLEPMRRDFRVPEMEASDVKALNDAISDLPGNSYIGYFYGTACREMLPVYIPLNPHAPIRPTADDLQTDLWIHPGGSVSSAVIQALRQIAVRAGLNGTTEVYSAAMVPQGCDGDNRADLHDVNWQMPMHGFKRWRGNVVVVKQLVSSCGAYEIVSMPADHDELKPASARVHPMPHYFWTTQDTVDELLTHADLLTAMALAKTSRHTRYFARSMFRRRVMRLILPFMRRSSGLAKVFFAMMRRTESGVGGSIATAALDWDIPVLGLRAPLISNLNILVPHGQQALWKRYIEGCLKGVLWTKSQSFGEYQHTADFVTTYALRCDDSLTITVTTSRTRSILPVLLSAGCTSQHNLLTSSHIICPNVKLTASGRAVLGWPSNITNMEVARMHKPFVPPPLHQYVHTGLSMAEWDEPCGWSCPGIKRQVRGFAGVGEFAWGDAYDVLSGDGTQFPALNPYREERLQWRLGSGCFNTYCLQISDAHINL